MTSVRSISSGKSATFPVIGTTSASYHTPGAEITGTQVKHNEKIINRYLNEVDKVFKKINLCLKRRKFPLKGKIKHSTFKRLTG